MLLIIQQFSFAKALRKSENYELNQGIIHLGGQVSFQYNYSRQRQIFWLV